MQSAHERKFREREDVGRWDVYQVTMTGTLAQGNPFRDVRLTADFHGPGGRTVTVSGFYDDENTWKARFCPDEVGDWRWSARLEGPGISASREGTFRCRPSENAGPLRPHPRNPALLADGRGDLVYLYGFRTMWAAEPWYIDGVKHERPADPFSDRDAIEYADTRISTYTTEDFLQDLADHGMNYVAMDTAHIG
jgi:hypothetical protein